MNRAVKFVFSAKIIQFLEIGLRSKTNVQCVPKKDAKIQITITTAHLIRINYPLSSFNYRFFGTNIANFNEIHHTVSDQQLLKQVAQLAQRDRAAGWVINGQMSDYRFKIGDFAPTRAS